MLHAAARPDFDSLARISQRGQLSRLIYLYDLVDLDPSLGAQAPAFAAYDFQPQSCGYGGTYGLDVFRGRVTFVALFFSG